MGDREDIPQSYTFRLPDCDLTGRQIKALCVDELGNLDVQREVNQFVLRRSPRNILEDDDTIAADEEVSLFLFQKLRIPGLNRN